MTSPTASGVPCRACFVGRAEAIESQGGDVIAYRCQCGTITVDPAWREEDEERRRQWERTEKLRKALGL